MNIKRYNELKKSSVTLNNDIPVSYTPELTDGNYAEGYIIRYFLQMRDSPGSPIFEVDRKEFSIHSTKPYYKGVSIKWRISGNLDERIYTAEDGSLIKHPSVMSSNRLVVAEAAKEMPDIKLYLVNLKQFWKAV